MFPTWAYEPYVTPIVSITLSTLVVASTSIQLDNEVDVQSLISSLNKLFEKNKFFKSIEKTLNSILDRMAKTMTPTITTSNIQQRATLLIKSFDNKFPTLSNVVIVQAQRKHDANLFDTICINVRNDMQKLNVCIKELR